VAWATFERTLRRLKEARAVYRRAYSRRCEEGGQYSVCAEWLRFEREEGRWVVATQGSSKHGQACQQHNTNEYPCVACMACHLHAKCSVQPPPPCGCPVALLVLCPK
jgi:hypothetical protein